MLESRDDCVERFAPIIGRRNVQEIRASLASMGADGSEVVEGLSTDYVEHLTLDLGPNRTKEVIIQLAWGEIGLGNIPGIMAAARPTPEQVKRSGMAPEALCCCDAKDFIEVAAGE